MWNDRYYSVRIVVGKKKIQNKSIFDRSLSSIENPIHNKQPSYYHNSVFYLSFYYTIPCTRRKNTCPFQFWNSSNFLIHLCFPSMCVQTGNTRKKCYEIFKSCFCYDEAKSSSMIIRIINSMWKLVWKTLVCRDNYKQ